MKNLVIIISFVLAFVCSSVYAQSTDAIYEQAMSKAVAKLDSSYTIPALKQQKNQFDRISSKYTKEWLPVYYSVYCNVQSVYMNAKAENSVALLDEAKEKLSALEKFENTDKSEVNTLWGYYFTALISLDPQNNGAKYFGQVMSYYKQAIAEDADNPRPVYLLAFFEKNLPPFMQQGKDFCAELQKAEILYQAEETKTIAPHWGREFLHMLQAKCNEAN